MRPSCTTRRPLAQALALGFLAACHDMTLPTEPPPTLAATGLFADAIAPALAAGVVPFAPQYPLWTDGAEKRRWIALPPGTSIDASDVDDWQFPIGTRLWKEFTFTDAREVRFMLRRADGTWLYASYVQRNGEPEARLAPATGERSFTPTQNGRAHDVPSHADCRLCHENGRTPVLGFSALQLSSDRDPNAPHTRAPEPGSADLAGAVARGLVRNLPERFLATPPRVPARSADERAALGWLHGNCSSCHNAQGPLQRLGLRLDVPLAGAPATAPAIATACNQAPTFRHPQTPLRLAPGDPAASLLWRRVAADDAVLQMPPFGRQLVDETARALLARWITHDLVPDTTAANPSLHEKR